MFFLNSILNFRADEDLGIDFGPNEGNIDNTEDENASINIERLGRIARHGRATVSNRNVGIGVEVH